MIGRDQVDVAALERFPELLAIERAADRRRALEPGHIRNGLGLEAQVVRACLDRDGQRPRARGGERREALGRGQVDDVHGGAVLHAQPHHQANRLDFGRGEHDLPAA